MKRKSEIDKLEKEIEEGKEVVDNHFKVDTATVGRPRKFLSSKEIIKTNLDLTKDMTDELDELAINLNISRQAVIKMMIRQELDKHYQARSAKQQTDKSA